MTGEEATLAVIEALDHVGVPYMLVGSFSSNAYGVVRATKDADIVVAWQGRSVSSVMKNLGSEFRLDPQMQFESVTGTIRSIIEVESIPFRVELFRLSDDPHDLVRFERRQRVFHAGFGRQILIPTPEDVIVTKLRWAVGAGRGKDRNDVRDVIAVLGDDALDWQYIYRWAEEHGTRDVLDEIRASIPEI
jgi:hypothetical protein